MPERCISAIEAEAVHKWMEGKGSSQRRHSRVPCVYVVDGEPLVIAGHFPSVIPWSNLFRLRFEAVTTGNGVLSCSEKHARQLEADGVISFTEIDQQSA